MHVVIHMFRDVQDNGHIYLPGDSFPREGVSVTPERCEQLCGSDNARGKPLIVKVDENCEACRIAPKTPVQGAQEKDKGIPAEDKKTAQRRPRARKKG